MVTASPIINNKSIAVLDLPMTGLDDLQELLFQEGFLLDSARRVSCFFEDAISSPAIRQLLEWEIPDVTDLSKILRIRRGGSVRGIRMDKYRGAANIKKPVVAGLLLKAAMERRLPKAGVDTLTDAGNMNTGFALKYYCEKLGLGGFYVMSRHFPEDMIEILRDDTFHVVQAPAQMNAGMEEEFYGYLHLLMKDREFRKNKHCLWHPKYGAEVMYPLGKEIAETLDDLPDYIVVSIGAGSTLACLCAVQDYAYDTKSSVPTIVVPEHLRSPIYSRIRPSKEALGVSATIKEDTCMETFCPEAFRSPPERVIPHSVIGPHYDKPNPFLSADLVNRIEYVQQYTDDEWMRTSHYLESHGLAIGNSSAAHVSVAVNLASLGYDVLTVIAEPMRSYYKTGSDQVQPS